MGWKSYIPFAGKKTVRKKLREIESEAATLPVIFGVMFTKIFESIVTYDYNLALRFSVASVLIAIIYVYKHEAAQKAKEAKEAVEEKTKENG